MGKKGLIRAQENFEGAKTNFNDYTLHFRPRLKKLIVGEFCCKEILSCEELTVRRSLCSREKDVVSI